MGDAGGEDAEGAGEPEVRDLLDQVDGLRDRVRRQRRPYPLWAALVAGVAALGAASFVLSDQLVSRSCQRGALGSLSCVADIRSYDEGWVWLLAAVLAVAVTYVRRYRRGIWRPSGRFWVAGALVVLVGIPAILPLVTIGLLPPIAYPVAAAVSLTAIAWRRGAPVAAGSALVLAVAMVLVDRRVAGPIDGPSWWLRGNLGLALSAAAVAVLAAVVALGWVRQDDRA